MDPRFVLNSTSATTSVAMLEMSDFPMDMQTDDTVFPDRKFVQDYLQRYKTHFGLETQMKYSTKVVNVAKEGAIWITIDQSGDTYRSRHLVVTSNRQPVVSSSTHKFSGFSGKTIEASQYSHASEHLQNKNVLVYAESSGGDICTELNATASHIYCASPHGQ